VALTPEAALTPALSQGERGRGEGIRATLVAARILGFRDARFLLAALVEVTVQAGRSGLIWHLILVTLIYEVDHD